MLTRFGDRLRVAMASSGRTKADVARVTDRSVSTIYRWLTLARPPEIRDYRHLWELAEYVNTNARHLWTGHGEPLRRRRPSAAEVEWMDKYHRLTPRQRDRFVTELDRPVRRARMRPRG